MKFLLFVWVPLASTWSANSRAVRGRQLLASRLVRTAEWEQRVLGKDSSGFRAALSVLHRRQNLKGSRVPFAFVVFVEHLAESGSLTGDGLEEGHARLQLQIIRRTENLERGSPLNGKDGCGTFTQPCSQHGVCKVRACFFGTLDGVVPGG